MHKANDYIQEMEGCGIVPNVTHTIHIFGYCNVGNTETSLKILKDMERKCLFLNFGYNAVIHGFCCER